MLIPKFYLQKLYSFNVVHAGPCWQDVRVKKRGGQNGRTITSHLHRLKKRNWKVPDL